MNESELRAYCLEHAGERLPAEAEALLARDPELKKQVDRLVAVSRLISLKKYEQPDADAARRCMTAVNRRILEREEAGLAARIREWFTFEQPVMAVAYAAAALVVCALGVGLLTNREPEAVSVAVNEAPAVQPQQPLPEPVQMRMEPVSPAVEAQIAEAVRENYAGFEKPLIVLRVDSNPGTSRMSFGSDASVPVSFDY